MSSLKRRPIGPGIFLPLVCSLLVWACAEPNDQAPGVDQAHAPRYILQHAAESDNDLNSCKSCHGTDLNGGVNATNCFSCHEDNLPVQVHPLPYRDPDAHGAAGRVEQHRCFACHGSAPNLFDGGILSDPDLFNAPDANCSTADCHPDAGAHPTRWQGDNDITGDYAASHRVVTTIVIRESCALCHQVAAQGRQPLPAAPSCFSASFRNSDSTAAIGCHSDGPGPSHDLPYDEPQQHGVPAKTDLSACQVCHGTPGTIKFDGGTSDTACSSNDCHPDAGAHPTNWQGDNDSGGYGSTHRNAPWSEQTCGICHNVSSSGSGPDPAAPSCFVPSYENSNNNGAIGCHSGGPGVTHDLPYDTPQLHGNPAKTGMNNCQICHGTPGTIKFDGGTSDTACSSNDCHPDAGAHPIDWQGENDQSGYRSTHRNAPSSVATCGICHDVNQGRQKPNAAAPSCFVGSYQNSTGSQAYECHSGGPGVGHALPYDTAQLHGDPAKTNIEDCQPCHGTPGTTSFDGGSSGVACSSNDCHPDADAHPSNWHGKNDSGSYQSTHRDATWSEATCGICHNVNSSNSGPNPAAPGCYVPRFENSNNNGEIGCHSLGPGLSHVHPYNPPALHGDRAKSDLRDCQFCHGTPGTTAFAGGTTDTACSSNDCHPHADAHPTDWRSGDDSHKQANWGTSTCGICHRVNSPGSGNHPTAPSCYVGSFNNSDPNTGSRGCHSGGPDD